MIELNYKIRKILLQCEHLKEKATINSKGCELGILSLKLKKRNVLLKIGGVSFPENLKEKQRLC